MPIFKDKTREILVKIVYYGPSLAGKSSSLKSLHQQIQPERRGTFHSWGSEADTILDFDLLPLSLNEIKTFQLRFQVFTIPGEVKSNRTRQFILEGVDAIVFVADSQRSRQKANLISLGNLKENLRSHGLRLDDIPLVYAYNKRDLKQILSLTELNHALNPTDRSPYVETIATKGAGVLKAFEIISNLVIQNLDRQLQDLAEELSSASDDLPELPGIPDFEETFDFAAELEPMISEEEQLPLLPYGTLLSETYHDGEIIFEEGDRGDRMYFIESGKVKIVAPHLTTKVLSEYYKGEFFGEMALLGEHLRSARAVAVGTTNLLPLTKEKLASQVHNRPEIAELFLETLSNRIRKENQTISELREQNKDLQERLKKAQEEAKQRAGQPDGLNTVDFTFKQGIDWQAFLISLQHLRKQMNMNPREADITVQGIERKKDGGFTVKVAVPQGSNRKKIYQTFLAQYKRQLALQRAKYQTLWQGKEQVIALCRRQAIDMQKILQTLSQKQYVHTSLMMTDLAQIHTKAELTALYTQLSQNIGELRRRYIQEKDLANRAKLKTHIKKAEAILTQIEQRLDSLVR
jgi:CRP-like cAMP-binding protein/signal recognition particle receptor subunit beta